MKDVVERDCFDRTLAIDMNSLVFGKMEMRKMFFRRGVRDIRSYAYLLKNLKLREFRNFLFTKNNVPTGEGFYRGSDGKLITRPDKIGIPPYVEIETTTVCNKRCTICEYIYWPKDHQIKRHMTFDEFKHIVDQFPKIRWANLTGEGSSFLNEDYPRMLRYLWERDRTSIWLVDHLDDISIEKLQREVLPYTKGIYVSMDAATKETYEKIKIGCDYDQVIRNLKGIIDLKRKHKTPFPHLCFRYIIIKDNVHEIPHFIDLINSLARPSEWGGSTSIIEFTGLLYFNEIQQHYVESIPRQLFNDILKRKGKGIDFIFSHAEEGRNPPISQCVAWLEPYIMLPGYVLPCCAVMMSNRRPFLRKYAFGNVFQNDFKNIWYGDYYKSFRNIINDNTKPVPKICAGCRAYQTSERIKRNGIWDPFLDTACRHQEVTALDLTIGADRRIPSAIG